VENRGSFVSVVGVVVLAAACQTTPKVSIEEAKKITAEQSDVSFVAPPRSIEDVTAILNQQKIAEPEKSERDYAAADNPPPASGDARELAEFYRKRGRAALKIGRNAQALTDFRKAAAYVPDAGLGNKISHAIYKNVGFAEVSAGNYKNAILAFHNALARRQTPVAYRGLAQIYARSGNFDAAEDARDNAQRMIEKMRSRRRIPDRALTRFNFEELTLKTLILEMQGGWAQAEVSRREELKILDGLAEQEVRPSKVANRKKALAENLMRQGRIVEAEVVARGALLEFLSKLGKSNATTADIVRKLAEILLAQGRLEDAKELSQAALRIFRVGGGVGSRRKIAATHRIMGSALAADSEWADAMSEFDRMAAAFNKNEKALGKMISGHPSAIITLIKVGRAKEALGYLIPKYKRLKSKLGAKHPDTSQAAVLMAMARAALGYDRKALAGFRSALPYYLARSRPREGENETNSTKFIWRAAILESYIDLLARIQNGKLPADAGFDIVEEAFQMAETARGGSVQQAVAASGARTFAGNPQLADFVRREQDARKRVAALFSRLADALGAPTDQQDPNVIADLRQRIDSLRNARSALMEELEKGFPEYADLINPKPPNIADLQKTLRPDEALISFYVGTDRSYVWAVPKQGAAKFHSVALGYDDLDDAVYHLRGALEPRIATVGATPDFDFAAAYELYRQFLKPVEPTFHAATNLLVVAHGPIGWLPLSLLPTEPFTLTGKPKVHFANYRRAPWLVNSHAVTLIPSVSALRTLRLLPSGNKTRQAFLGFGDPLFAPSQGAVAEKVTLASATGPDKAVKLLLRSAPKTRGLEHAGLSQLPRLADTATEIKSMARALGSNGAQNLFLEAKASEDQVKALDLTDYRVVAFATHGLVPGDLDGLVQPALALSSPTVTGGKEDGLLTMGEILGLHMDADWVVLSACNTASGNGAGAEAVSGLGRAFFYAGTRALLVSNWPVQSDSAMLLTTGIFHRQAADPALSRAHALRQSMLELINRSGFLDSQGRMLFSYAHPIFWAPFALMGDG